MRSIAQEELTDVLKLPHRMDRYDVEWNYWEAWKLPNSIAGIRLLELWARNAQQSGGFALESGVHEVDTVRFLAGEVESVTARVRYDDPDHPGFDTDYRALLTLRASPASRVPPTCGGPSQDTG